LIPNVTRGGRVRGLIGYLVGAGHAPHEPGPEQARVHTNPHLVAGTEELIAGWGGYDLSPAVNPAAAREIAAILDEPRMRSGTRVTVGRKDQDGNVLVDDRGAPVRKDAHVWHCSLSLHPSEPALSDERWRGICEEFVTEMGFAGDSCRWAAIHHGPTANGGDHVHIVVQLVSESGKPAGVHNDRPRAQECARQLERKHRLRVVEGRAQKRGARSTNRRQLERAHRERQRGQVPSSQPDQELLERAVRALGLASSSETEFIQRIRTFQIDGRALLIRPRWAAERDDQVVGYSVALQRKDPVWHAGGRLAKDLTLPRLRSHWPDEPPVAAIEEWRRAWLGLPAAGRSDAPTRSLELDWDRALADLQQLHTASGLTTADAAPSAEVAGQAAGVLYGWAELLPEHAEPLRACGRELAQLAQIRARLAQPKPPQAPAARGVALLCAAMMQPTNPLLYYTVLARELAALMRTIADVHKAAGEARAAARIEAVATAGVDRVRATLEDRRAAIDPTYARGRESRRLAAIAAPPRRPPAADSRPGETQRHSSDLSAQANEARRLTQIASPLPPTTRPRPVPGPAGRPQPRPLRTPRRVR
jgi:Relaxase/Mobilisation nuclease domain